VNELNLFEVAAYFVVTISYVVLSILASRGPNIYHGLYRYALAVTSLGVSVLTVRLLLKEDYLKPLLNTIQSLVHHIGLNALAQSPGQSPHVSDSFVSVVFGLILAVMLITFLGSVAVLFLATDIPQNKSRISAADNLAKTLGGFFIGILTSIIKQSIS